MVEEQIRKRMDNRQIGGDNSRVCRLWNKTKVGGTESMYFGLTNSPATFQVMMNDILWDLIDKGDVAAFIDDVIVGTETEEGHDEIVKKC